MNKRFTAKKTLFALGAALLLTTALAACRSPTGGTDKEDGLLEDPKYSVTFWVGETKQTQSDYTEGYINLIPESKIKVPPVPANPQGREGWQYAGWFKSETFTPDQQWDFDRARVTEDINLYALFLDRNDPDNSITISFDLKGGTWDGNDSIPPQQIARGDKLTKPSPDPVKANAQFKAWRSSRDGHEVEIGSFSNIHWLYTETLYAAWQEPYIVTLDPNGGVFEDSTDLNADGHKVIRVEEGEKLTIPAITFSKSATAKAIWENENNKVWDLSQPVIESMKLTAKWVQTVTLKSPSEQDQYNNAWQKGMYQAGLERSFEVPLNSTIPFTDAVFDAFIVPEQQAGPTDWLDEYKQSWDRNTPVTEDMMLTAKWEDFTVTFVTGKIGLTKGKQETVVLKGNSISQLRGFSAPEKAQAVLGTGKVSKEWYYEEGDLSRQWNEIDSITKNVTLRAKYEGFKEGDPSPDSVGLIFHVNEAGFPVQVGEDEIITARYLEIYTKDGKSVGGDNPRFKWTDGSHALSSLSGDATKALGRGRFNTALIVSTDQNKSPWLQGTNALDGENSVGSGSGTWFLPNVEEFKKLAASEAVRNYLCNLPTANKDDLSANQFWLSNAPNDFGKATSATVDDSGAVTTKDEPITTSLFVILIRAW